MSRYLLVVTNFPSVLRSPCLGGRKCIRSIKAVLVIIKGSVPGKWR